VAFAITTNGGADFTVSASAATVAGSGWVNVDAIRLESTGEILPVTWTGGSAWQITVPLAAGVNAVSLTALNMQDAAVGTDTVTITNNGPEAASAANTVISEIHYHPADPDGGTLEFIELQNIGQQTVDFTGCAFTAGVDFAFPAAYSIPPGGYALVVQNAAAFNARYGAGLPVAGEWSALTRLSNGGDRIALINRGGAAIRDFSYDDAAPWPVTPDGAGNTLVLLNPAANPDHALAANWRASTATGGSPGAADPGPPAGFHQQPIAVSEALVSPPQAILTENKLQLVWTERANPEGLLITPQVSTDLLQWQSDPGDGSLIEILSAQDSAAGRTVTAQPAPGPGTLYFRLLISRP